MVKHVYMVITYEKLKTRNKNCKIMRESCKIIEMKIFFIFLETYSEANDKKVTLTLKREFSLTSFKETNFSILLETYN